MYCEALKAVNFADRGEAWGASVNAAGDTMFVFVPADATVASINSTLSGTKIVHELATPVVGTPITTAELLSLYGNNNVWADTGDVSVTYRADTGLYIDKKLGA